MKSWVTRSLCEASRRLDPAADGELISDLSKIVSLAEERLECAFWHPATKSLLDDLAFADTLEGVSFYAREVRDALGLQHVTICAVREAAGSIFSRRVLTTCPPEWSREYTENKYQLSDPAFLDPVPEKPALLHELAALSPITEGYLRNARRAGIGPSGLVCWSKISEGTVVAVVLTSSITPAEFLRRMERMEWDLIAVADELASAFARANGLMQPDPATLTDDDLTLLRAIARGDSELSAVLDDEILCRRLGARTLAQAAVAVASSGILSYAPVSMDDIWFAEAPPSARRKRSIHRTPQLTSLLSRPPATRERGRKVPGAWGVRKWLNGWAVFRDDLRVSEVFACEREAERACTQAAWGAGAVGASQGRELETASFRQ